MAEVYVLHFERPYWGDCQHYTGYTKFDAEKRLEKHRAGNGSLLVAFALNKGIDFKCVYTEEAESCAAARRREKQLKAKGAKKICAICQGGAG